MEEFKLNSLLEAISNEVTDSELAEAQSNMACAQSNEAIRMIYRMFAADSLKANEE
ncbi:hypothetical protein [Lysinibacillus xylanilyticus]|uniref:hypothetical protein n=1 Tax=Lysinibacillus xylanilyticus TaxID=582475 RepID=UPI003D020368